MNTTVISITTQHDKICLLEQFIKHINIESTTLEKIVSNFIDAVTEKCEKNVQIYLDLLKDYINNKNLLECCIQLSISISENIPILVTLEVNNNTKKYIYLIEKNNKIGFPIF